MLTIDPVVEGIAEIFVDELIRELPELGLDLAAGRDPVSRKIWRNQVINRAAHAMQQALEDELDAVRRAVISGAPG
jgi:hypothetical protein